jgi:hypothetical protein
VRLQFVYRNEPFFASVAPCTVRGRNYEITHERSFLPKARFHRARLKGVDSWRSDNTRMRLRLSLLRSLPSIACAAMRSEGSRGLVSLIVRCQPFRVLSSRTQRTRNSHKRKRNQTWRSFGVPGLSKSSKSTSSLAPSSFSNTPMPCNCNAPGNLRFAPEDR